MAVEHDVLGAAVRGLNDVDDEGTAALWLEDLLGDSRNFQLVDVAVNQLHGLLDEAVGQEVGIVVGRKVGDSDKFTETLDVPVFPLCFDVCVSGGLVDR